MSDEVETGDRGDEIVTVEVDMRHYQTMLAHGVTVATADDGTKVQLLRTWEKAPKTADDSDELTPQEEWEKHNESFNYEPPELPGDAWSSEQYQELHDRVISRRTEWFCDKCSGRGPISSLQKARRHVQSQHGQQLVEKHETPREEQETATDGGTSPSKTEQRESKNHGLAEFSPGDRDE